MVGNELKEIREKISCPQLGDNHYGEWGILTLHQRLTIKRMLDCIDAQEKRIRSLQAENEGLKAENKSSVYKEVFDRIMLLPHEVVSKVLSFDLDDFEALHKELVGDIQ